MTGNLKAIDVGLGKTSKKLAASSLKGTMVNWEWYRLLDSSQEYYGSGTATMTLNIKQTKAANAGSLSVGTVISSLIDTLVKQGYTSVI